MKSIDEIVAEKIIDMINYVLSKIIKPDIEIEKITDIDEKVISRLKKEYDIEGIILDVDETLRKDMKNTTYAATVNENRIILTIIFAVPIIIIIIGIVVWNIRKRK